MKKNFFDALRRFEQALTLLNGWARRTQRDEWMGPPEADRDRCSESFEKVVSNWAGTAEELVELQALFRRCLSHYAQGQIDDGEFDIRDIDAFLATLKERISSSNNIH